MLEYIMLPAPLKWSYGNKAERYSERIVAKTKQESLILFIDDVKITPVDYKFFLWFGSLIFEDSLAFVMQHDKMVVNSVDPCCV